MQEAWLFLQESFMKGFRAFDDFDLLDLGTLRVRRVKTSLTTSGVQCYLPHVVRPSRPSQRPSCPWWKYLLLVGCTFWSRLLCGWPHRRVRIRKPGSDQLTFVASTKYKYPEHRWRKVNVEQGSLLHSVKCYGNRCYSIQL